VRDTRCVGVVPTGTVTFLFTDVESSTPLWERQTAAMEAALARHDALIRAVIDGRDGYVFSTAGDSFAAAFARAGDAVVAAVDLQRLLADEPWPESMSIRVRIGVHTGEAQERDGDFFGPAVIRAARIMSVAHGGQVVVSENTRLMVDAQRIGAEFINLGTHPLKGLSEPVALWQVAAPGLVLQFPPLATTPRVVGNLPSERDPVLGRDVEVRSLAELLEGEPLVTLVGVGGVGKTTLATAAARAANHRFPDGVWLCELASVGDGAAVAQVVADVLGVRQRVGHSMSASIGLQCRGRELMVVLDNCEHVVDAAAEVARAIIESSPRSRVLATSRVGLGEPAEHLVPVGPLDASTMVSPAAELFIRHATRLGVAVTEADRPVVRRICARLDGIPLAVELAASRTRSLTPAEIEPRLDDAFRLLRGGRSRIEHHRTLSAAVDWSYRLLTDDQRRLFDRLAVFAGSFDLAAAEAVAGTDPIDPIDVVDLLDDLVANSLVLAERHGSTTRYRLLEPLRQFAEDQLAHRREAQEIRDRHLRHFAAWTHRWQALFFTIGYGAPAALDNDTANLRTAIDWAITRRDTDHALQLLAPMSIAQQQLLRLEFGDWARAALELPGVDEHPLGPAVASIAAMAHFWRSEIDEFVGLVERLGEMRHRRASDATSVGPEFVAALIQDGAGAAAARLDEIDLDADAGAAVPVAWLRSTLGPPHLPSPELVAQVARLAEQTDSPLLRAFWHAIVGSRAQWSGDFTAATEAFRTTIALARDLDAPYFTHWCVSHLCASGTMADLLTPDDLALITNALREQRDAGQLQDQWLVLHGAATLLARRGRQDLALDITAGIAASPWGETGSPISRHRLPTPQDIVEAELQSRTVRPLDELVDDVLTQLDAWRGTVINRRGAHERPHTVGPGEPRTPRSERSRPSTP